ncbi:lambda exonuclease family protein [Microbulbifer thermotolerans]|uniref:YqaJ viral recombinase family protein n=1 Tax=Microbulbifer thermotolerans TaxID=252514 RepID=A0AB35HYA2_MICTH|nr:lambda exonuclease family protein [Microbulbifer thermotolerans]MCX2780396.1 YqaJ viral recombinase family protein [Microbulbifer thermotolerans]MCX2802230.1 YqaJ viral recombinase family protein [Microbulbifer thermotolerans]MCX2805932.1 YqaJ viral recombinase family protein [Microbulbifer thermotolerans]
MSNDFQQNADWHKQRAGRITGSRVGAILGMSPFAKPEDVLREMVRDYHGAEREFEGNVATEYGNEHENTAIAALEQETGEIVISTGFHVHQEFDWLGASPDGLIGDDGIVEIKCPYGLRNSDSPEFKTLDEQPHYYAQIQLAMHCTGKRYCEFFQWAPNGTKRETVQRDDAWLDRAMPELREFYAQYLETINSEELSKPHLEPLEREREDSDWKSAVEEYRKAAEAAKAAAEQEKAAKAQLIEMANGCKTRGCGVLVYPVERKGSISYAKAIKDLLPDADLEKYRGKSSTSWAVKLG